MRRFDPISLKFQNLDLKVKPRRNYQPKLMNCSKIVAKLEALVRAKPRRCKNNNHKSNPCGFEETARKLVRRKGALSGGDYLELADYAEKDPSKVSCI